MIPVPVWLSSYKGNKVISLHTIILTSMTEENDDGKASRTPLPDEGLYIPPMMSRCVADRPLDESTREFFRENISFLTSGRDRLPEVNERDVLFAFRRERGFIAASLSKDYERTEGSAPLELVDFDPVSGRSLSVGKGTMPLSVPIIWWGFKLFVRTNFALLLVGRPPKKESVEPVKTGYGFGRGSRLHSILSLSEMRFPMGPMIDVFTSGKPGTPDEPACNLDTTTVEFSDGVLYLARNREDLLV